MGTFSKMQKGHPVQGETDFKKPKNCHKMYTTANICEELPFDPSRNYCHAFLLMVYRGHLVTYRGYFKSMYNARPVLYMVQSNPLSLQWYSIFSLSLLKTRKSIHLVKCKAFNDLSIETRSAYSVSIRVLVPTGTFGEVPDFPRKETLVLLLLCWPYKDGLLRLLSLCQSAGTSQLKSHAQRSKPIKRTDLVKGCPNFLFCFLHHLADNQIAQMLHRS